MRSVIEDSKAIAKINDSQGGDRSDTILEADEKNPLNKNAVN